MKNLTLLLKKVVIVFCVILLYCYSPATALAATGIDTVNQSGKITNNVKEGDHNLGNQNNSSFCKTLTGIAAGGGSLVLGGQALSVFGGAMGLTGGAAVTSGLATLGALLGGGMIAGLGAVALTPLAVGTLAGMAFCQDSGIVVNNSGVLINGDVNAPQNHK
jgi:hypothetical protein